MMNLGTTPRTRPSWMDQALARPSTRRGEPSAIALLSIVTLGTIVLALFAALVITSPMSVTIPLALVFGTGLVAAVLLSLLDKRRAFRRSRTGALRRRTRWRRGTL